MQLEMKVGKNEKLENSSRSWKIFDCLIKILHWNFSNFDWSSPTYGDYLASNFLTSCFSNCPFQLHVSHGEVSNEMTRRYWKVRHATRKFAGFIGALYCLEIFLFLGTGWDAFQPDIRDLHAGLLGLGFLFENVLSITSPGWMISCTNEKPAKIYIFGFD